jgi:hypothetical protein
MAPQAVAATTVESAVTPTVSRSYELTALPSPLLLASLSLGSAGTTAPSGNPGVGDGVSTGIPLRSIAAAPAATINDVLALASLPVQNLWTVVTTFGQLTNFVTPLNKAMALVAAGLTTGNWDVAAITAQVRAAIDVTVAAIRNIINLPATIISTDIQAIGNAINPTALAGASTLDTPSVQAAPTAAATAAAQANNPINDFLTVASLPAQNAWTVVTTFGQLTNFVTPLNKAMALVATGLTTGNWNVDAIGAQVQAAFDVTVTAVRNIVNLPATIIKHDIQTVGSILNPSAQTTAGSSVQTLRTTNTSDTPTPADAAAAPAGKEKHTWKSLQTAVRSDFESEIAAFDGGLPRTDEATAEDAPAKGTAAEETPAEGTAAEETPAEGTPDKDEAPKDAPAKDGKDASADKKTNEKDADKKDASGAGATKDAEKSSAS